MDDNSNNSIDMSNNINNRYNIANNSYCNILYLGCHPILLDKNDEFLSTLLKPLADVNDNLDGDEIEKLPFQLQYYEGYRCQDPLITNKIIESLYQTLHFDACLKLPHTLFEKSDGKEEQRVCNDDINYNDDDDNRNVNGNENVNGNGSDDCDDEGG
ncbi:unnamed protein product, partial [Acanthocheilonema viteae]